MIQLDKIVTGFAADEKTVDCLCGKELIKVDKTSKEIVLRKEILEKDGLSRRLVAFDKEIWFFDFCFLYGYKREDFQLIGKWRLGEDLQSDICGILCDEQRVYCPIRNGKLVTVDRFSRTLNEYDISNSSIWSLAAYEDSLIAGSVDGCLMLFDRNSLSLKKRVQLSNQNIRSFYIRNHLLYCACQDKKLYIVDLNTFAVVKTVWNMHQKMFDCVGIHQDRFLTISAPCSEIRLWDSETFEKRDEIRTPLKLSAVTCLTGDRLYIASHNLLGIQEISLAN